MSFGKKKLMTNLTEVKGIQYCVCDSVKQKKQALGVHCSYHSVISQTSHLTALKVFYLFISKDGGGGGGGGDGRVDRASSVERFPIQNCIKGFYLNRKRENQR